MEVLCYCLHKLYLLCVWECVTFKCYHVSRRRYYAYRTRCVTARIINYKSTSEKMTDWWTIHFFCYFLFLQVLVFIFQWHLEKISSHYYLAPQKRHRDRRGSGIVFRRQHILCVALIIVVLFVFSPHRKRVR